MIISKRSILCLLGLATLIASAGVLILLCRESNPQDEDWRLTWQQVGNRDRIARTLISKQILNGMTEKELLAALGAPDKTQNGGEKLLWFAGNRRSKGSLMFVHQEFLAVHLGAGGRVEKSLLETYD